MRQNEVKRPFLTKTRTPSPSGCPQPSKFIKIKVSIGSDRARTAQNWLRGESHTTALRHFLYQQIWSSLLIYFSGDTKYVFPRFPTFSHVFPAFPCFPTFSHPNFLFCNSQAKIWSIYNFEQENVKNQSNIQRTR